MLRECAFPHPAIFIEPLSAPPDETAASWFADREIAKAFSRSVARTG